MSRASLRAMPCLAPLREDVLDVTLWTLGLAAAAALLLAFGRVGLPIVTLVALATMLGARRLARFLLRSKRGAPSRARFDAATPAWERSDVLLMAARRCVELGALDDAAAFTEEALAIDPSCEVAHEMLRAIARARARRSS